MSFSELLVNPLKENLVQWLGISTKFMSSRIQDFEFIFHLGRRMKVLSDLDILDAPEEIQGILNDLDVEKRRVKLDLAQVKDKELRRYLTEVITRSEEAEVTLGNTLKKAQELVRRIEGLNEQGVCHLDHTPNKLTLKTFRETDEGKNLVHHENAEAMFAYLYS